MDLIDEILGGDMFGVAEPEPVLELTVDHLDRVRGMLTGVALGDALGGPHEFRYQVKLDRYSGCVEFPLQYSPRYQGKKTGNVGQITDDTEMTITLADTLSHVDGYNRDRAVTNYMAWANSNTAFLGQNTRALFVGIKTLKGFNQRHRTLHNVPLSEWTQSNGCLMRCSPLAALPENEWAAAAASDCSITNPSPVCVDGVLAYIAATRALLAGASAEVATAAALAYATTPTVVTAITEGRDGTARDVSDLATKGWIAHALYCAFAALNDNRSQTFQDRIDVVIRRGGDTDTNGAIAGALLGAQLGVNAMLNEDRTARNAEIVLTVNPHAGELPRPAHYAANRIPVVAHNLAAL